MPIPYQPAWPLTALLSCLLLVLNYGCTTESAALNDQASTIAERSFWSEDPFAHPALSSRDSMLLGQVQVLKILVEKNPRAASRSLDSLLAHWQKNGNPSAFVLGHAWYQRGCAAYHADEDELCIPAYEKAIAYLKQAELADMYLLATLNKNLSQNFTFSGNHIDSALHYGQQAIRILAQGPEKPDANLALRVYNSTGAAAGRLGDYGLARQCFRKSVVLCTDTTIEYYLKAQTLYNYADVFYRNNEFDSAYIYNQQSLKTYLDYPDLDGYDSLDIAKIYQRLALVFNKWDQPAAEGLSHIKQAIGLFDKLHPASRDLSISYNIAGLLYDKSGQREAAATYYKKAVVLNKKLEEHFQLGENYDNLGDWWADSGQLPLALDHYDKAIRCFRGANNSSSVRNAQYRLSLFTPLASRATTLYHLHQQNPALLPELFMAYAQLDTLLQSIREDYTDEQSKIFTLAKVKPVYEEAIDVCFLGWEASGESIWLDRAITYFERSKGLILRETIQRDQAMKELLSTAHHTRMQTLQRLRNYCFQQSQNGQLAVAERQLFKDRRLQAELELRLLRDTLTQTYPRYRALSPLQEVPDKNGLQALLKTDEHLLDFFVGKNGTYCLSIAKKQADLIRIPLMKGALTAQVQAFRKNLEAPLNEINGGAKEQDQQLRSNGHALYQQLLSGALKPDQRKNLILFPDDVLAYLPFETLLSAPVADHQAEYYHKYPFLIKDYTISYQFSLGLWQTAQRQHPQASNSGILAVVPTQAKSLEVSLANRDAIRLPALAYNQEEVEKLEVLGRLDILAGPTAKKEAFLAKAPQYAVLHFAGHGNADPSNAYRSFLAFDLQNSKQQNDELILLPELYTLNIPAEMVVLSACQTADGQLSVGEGVLSLSRAMTLAGARSVVSSLWLVNQESKVDFFGAFYSYLAAGQPKDDALRSAKLSYLQKTNSPWSHPYHWAGMVLVGDTAALSETI